MSPSVSIWIFQIAYNDHRHIPFNIKKKEFPFLICYIILWKCKPSLSPQKMSLIFLRRIVIIITVTSHIYEAFSTVLGTPVSTELWLTCLNLCSLTLFHLHNPPCYSSNSFCHRAFALIVPSVWNALPRDVHPHGSLSSGLRSNVTYHLP